MDTDMPNNAHPDPAVTLTQLRMLHDIDSGETEYIRHDRRTLNALQRRGLVECLPRRVKLTRNGAAFVCVKPRALETVRSLRRLDPSINARTSARRR